MKMCTYGCLDSVRLSRSRNPLISLTSTMLTARYQATYIHTESVKHFFVIGETTLSLISRPWVTCRFNIHIARYMLYCISTVWCTVCVHRRPISPFGPRGCERPLGGVVRHRGVTRDTPHTHTLRAYILTSRGRPQPQGQTGLNTHTHTACSDKLQKMTAPPLFFGGFLSQILVR